MNDVAFMQFCVSPKKCGFLMLCPGGSLKGCKPPAAISGKPTQALRGPVWCFINLSHYSRLRRFHEACGFPDSPEQSEYAASFFAWDCSAGLVVAASGWGQWSLCWRPHHALLSTPGPLPRVCYLFHAGNTNSIFLTIPQVFIWLLLSFCLNLIVTQ